jgi:hypothetical protein
MAKILWLALLCAPLVGALFVLWTTIINASTRPPANPITTRTDTARASVDNDDGPLAKADRLPLREISTSQTNTELQPVPPKPSPIMQPAPAIAPATPLLAKPTAISNARPATSEATSWHWHAGSNAIKRR